jgi:hypothetical protein
VTLDGEPADRMVALSDHELDQLRAAFVDATARSLGPLPAGLAADLVSLCAARGQWGFAAVVADYLRGEIDEAGFVKALGIYKPKRQRRPSAPAQRAAAARFLVEHFRACGYPKSPPDTGEYKNTAYHKAAEALGVAPATVLAYCKGRR